MGVNRIAGLAPTFARAQRSSFTVSAAAAGAAGGDEVFPRIKERDPYRRLGISKEASYEEIQDARNYLVETYSVHQKSVESIEQAFDKIISQKLRVRKKSGIKLRDDKKDDKEPASGIQAKIQGMMDPNPNPDTMKKVAAIYVGLTAWSLVMSAATGPAFQLCLGFFACVFFFNEKRQKLAKAGESKFWGAMGSGILSLFAGWFIGSLLPVAFPIFPTWIAPETIASLTAFITMGCAAVFTK